MFNMFAVQKQKTKNKKSVSIINTCSALLTFVQCVVARPGP